MAKSSAGAKSLATVKEPLNALYYGDGGTGKTCHMAAMARLGRVLVINAEKGLKKRPLQALGIPIENIEIEDGLVTYDSLDELFWRIRQELEEDPEAYAGVIWDSATEVHKALLDRAVEKSVRVAKKKGQERDPDFIERGDYGVMTEQMRRLVRRFRDLPCHFAMSALERRTQDDDGRVSYGPALTPALQNDVYGYVDVVVRTSVAQVGELDEYRGLCRPHGKYQAKDRLGVFPKWLPEPTFDRLVAYADGELDADRDAVLQAARERQEAAKRAEEQQTNNTESEQE